MDNQHHDPATGAEGAPRSPGRRRFASTGIKASGVILTLASPPGMAAVCKSPSGSLSGNLRSSPGQQAVVCSGLSPGYWKNWTDSWPAGCYATSSPNRPATLFASVFPNGGTKTYQTGTMLEVLNCNQQGEDPHNLGAHLVAAFLNVKSAKISYLTVASLKTIWYELGTYGYYTPMAGKKWYAKEVADYLASTEH